jgi:hypothetical protein
LDYKLSHDADFTVVNCLIPCQTLHHQDWACCKGPPPVVIIINIVSRRHSHPPESRWQGCRGNDSRVSNAADDCRNETSLSEEDEQMSILTLIIFVIFAVVLILVIVVILY